MNIAIFGWSIKWFSRKNVCNHGLMYHAVKSMWIQLIYLSMCDIAKTWNHAWAVICNLSISWMKPKKHLNLALDAARTEKLWGVLETSFGAVDTACLEKNYMRQNLIPPQAHVVQGKASFQTIVFWVFAWWRLKSEDNSSPSMACGEDWSCNHGAAGSSAAVKMACSGGMGMIQFQQSSL